MLQYLKNERNGSGNVVAQETAFTTFQTITNMKLLFPLLVAFTLLASTSFADCAGSGLYAFPDQKEVRTNNLFLLEGYAHSQHIIKGLNTEFPIYLKYGDETIRLVVQETHTGQFFLTQALLKPEKFLTEGKEYTLVIDNLPDQEGMYRYNIKTRKREAITYIASGKEDHRIPAFTTAPKEKEKSFISLGCGPAVDVTFSFNVSDDLDDSDNSDLLLMRTSVKSADSDSSTTYLVVCGNKCVSIGHNMCSGAFTFIEGQAYRVQFKLLDFCGNEAEKVSEWISFTSPTNTDSPR